MKITDVIQEDLSKWGKDWVHYTNHPMLAINPKPSHMDPAGIYFFPASVVPDAEMWHTMRYQFTVNLRPDARILDADRITAPEIWRLIDGAGIRDSYTKYISDHPPANLHKMFDMAWEWLQRRYFLELHRKPAAFNAVLRQLGYDAVFDDTGSIHSGEPQQLLVLDPRVITNVRMMQRSGSGFAAVQKVVGDLTTLASEYGQVTASPIKKPNARAYSGDSDYTTLCNVAVENPQNKENYATFKVGSRKDYPDRVSVSLLYSRPRLNYGVGLEYAIGKQQYIWKDISELRRHLDQIFAQQQNAA